MYKLRNEKGLSAHELLLSGGHTVVQFASEHIAVIRRPHTQQGSFNQCTLYLSILVNVSET